MPPALNPKRIVLILSWKFSSLGFIVQIIIVFEFPPKEFYKYRVNLLSL